MKNKNKFCKWPSNYDPAPKAKRPQKASFYLTSSHTKQGLRDVGMIVPISFCVRYRRQVVDRY